MKAKRVTCSKVTSRYLLTFMSMHCKIVYMLFESKNVIDIIRVVIPLKEEITPLVCEAFVFYRISPFSLFRGAEGGGVGGKREEERVIVGLSYF